MTITIKYNPDTTWKILKVSIFVMFGILIAISSYLIIIPDPIHTDNVLFGIVTLTITIILFLTFLNLEYEWITFKNTGEEE